MKGTKAAKRYAQGFFTLGKEKNLLEVLATDAKGIKESVFSSKELRDFLNSPIYKADVKQNILGQTFSSISDLTKQFIGLLIQQKRENLLGESMIHFLELYDKETGVQNASVITAVPINDALKQKVLEKAATLTDKKIILTNTVNPEIIGGFILRIGDREFNTSIASKYTKLKDQFDDNHYIKKY